VQEIRGYEKPTLIANAPPFIKGVINLRGTIVPIVDLRIKFNLGKRSTRLLPSSSSSTLPARGRHRGR
jgi:chemotaxis signal transduction protein